MGRAANTCSAEDYEKCLLGNKTSVLRSDLSKPLDEFCEKHGALIVDLLGKTPRISKAMLSAALLSLEGQDASDARSFAGKVVEVVSTARALSKSWTTGKKTSAHMSQVVRAILQWSQSPLPVQREPSKSPRDNAPGTPTRTLPKKRLHSKTSPIQAKQLFHEVAESPPLRKLSKSEVMAQLGLVSGNEPPGSAMVAAEVEAISSTESEGMVPVAGSSTDKKPVAPSTDSSQTFWINSAIPCLMRSNNGKVEQASMKAGPHGFAIAVFEQPFEEKLTEIPNLNLVNAGTTPPLKKPASCKRTTQKRPATAMSSNASGSDENSVMADEAPTATGTMGYNFMTYPTGAVAIRETKLGKRQLFQIMNRSKSHQQLCEIMEQARQMLLAGEAAEKVKLWAKGQAAA